MYKTSSCFILALLSTGAYAAPQLFGSAFSGVLVENTETTTTNLNTGEATTSKAQDTHVEFPTIWFGIKGSESINDTLEVSYHLEYATTISDDAKPVAPKSRNTYLGLKHKRYGALQVGRMGTSDWGIDYVDQSYLYAQGADVPFLYNGQRVNNAVLYKSPTFNQDKTQVFAQYALKENDKGGAEFELRDWLNKTYLNVNHELAVVGVTHSNDKVDYGATYSTAGKNFHALRLSSSYKVNDKVQLAIMGQVTDYNARSKNSKKELGVIAGATYQYSRPLQFYVQGGYADNYGGHPDGSNKIFSMGGVYEKTDNISLYGSVSGLRKKSYDHSFDDDKRAYNNNLVSEQALGVETGVYFTF